MVRPAVSCAKCGAPLTTASRFCGTCGHAVLSTETAAASVAMPSPLPELVGREIGGRYRMLAKLGEGGMGAVYRAEQISLKRKVAVKLLRPELSSEPGLVRRFNAEAELAAKLNHPNTVNIYDFGQDGDGTLFIAMEYVEGKSLRNVLAAEGAMPAGRALNIVAQITSSLADAHAHGIVHRDLKPDNVMLTERGKQRDVVRVLDFGIAKLRDDGKGVEQAMTRAGDLVGTPQYMAPEQIRAEAVDGRTDVYAVGAMLFEMLTGRLPFEGPTLMAILSRHLTEPAEPPSRRRPDLAIPPALDALVLETLAKDPAQRTPSMERFGEQVAEIAAALGAPVSVGAPTGSATAQVPVGAAATPLPAPATAPPGPPPGAPAVTPMAGRPMRPPGVPHTYPPGAMSSPPEPPPPPPSSPVAYAAVYPVAPAPAVAPAPPAVAPAMYPPPPVQAPLVQAPLVQAPVVSAGGGRGVVWALVALALAGAGVGVFLLVRKGAGTSSAPAKTGSDVWAGSSATEDDDAGDDQPQATGGDPWTGGQVITSPRGSSLQLPAGMTRSPMSTANNAVQYYVGTVDGIPFHVAMIDAAPTEATQVAEKLLAGNQRVGGGQQTIRGQPFTTDYLQGKDTDEVTLLQFEALVLTDQSHSVFVLVGTTVDRFADSAALRNQQYAQHFAP